MVSSHLPSGVQSGEAITVDTGEAFGNDFSFVDLIEPGGAQSENTGKVQKFSSPILREFETGLGGGCNAHDEADLEKFNVGFSTNNTGDVNAPSVGPTPTSPCHGVAQDIPASSSPDLRCNIGVCLKEAILMLLPSQCPEWKQFSIPPMKFLIRASWGSCVGRPSTIVEEFGKKRAAPSRAVDPGLDTNGRELFSIAVKRLLVRKPKKWYLIVQSWPSDWRCVRETTPVIASRML